MLDTLTIFILLFVAIIVIGVIAYQAFTGKWEQLRAEALFLILQAEKHVTGTKQGKLRLHMVIDAIYELIPPWARLFISESAIEKLVQECFDRAKDYLDDCKFNNSQEKIDPG